MSSTSTLQSSLRVVARPTEADAMDGNARENVPPPSRNTGNPEKIDYAATWPNDQGVRDCDCSLHFLTGDHSVHRGKLELTYLDSSTPSEKSVSPSSSL